MSAGPLQQYGALPWRRDRRGRLRVLLVTSRGRGRWIVPKGWPAEDRPPYLGAALEAFEKAGVIGDILTQPLSGYLDVKETADGTPQQRHVTLFGLRVRATLTHWPGRGQRMRAWFDPHEAADAVDNARLAEIIRGFDDRGPAMEGRPGFAERIGASHGEAMRSR